MNKKILYGMILPLIIAVVLVTAGWIAHYGSISQEIEIQSPIEVTGEVTESIEGWANTEISGEETITVKNIADMAVDVRITNSNSAGEHIEVSYVGELVLAKKTILDTVWTPLTETADQITIKYTVVGNTFEYDVIDGTLPSDYVLVYAMDKDNRFTDYATVMKLDEVNQNLPFANDWNAGEEADYCKSPIDVDYTHCKGAKIWAIPSGDISETVNTDGTSELNSWANMWDFYWETDLVEYNAEGQITIYPGETLDFTPLYKLGNIDGNYTVTTNVNPITA